VDKPVENSNPFREWLRNAARKESQRQQEHPKSDEATWAGTKELSRRRLQQAYPNLDEAAVGEIVENVADVYQVIPAICRRRLQQERSTLDELEVQMVMMLIARPPIQMVESALIQKMHLPAEDRIQQVAAMMVDRILGL